ncbi:MAG: hypothetical protein MZU97_26240 [Bacillus subtilis]|nr:hypothetical protein [Bacillus subtilis]
MNLIKRIPHVASILFLLSVYVTFVYTLSMMTDATTLSFYQDFLDPSVKVFIASAGIINQAIFARRLDVVVVSVVLYAFQWKKGNLGFVRLALGLGVVLFALVAQVACLQQLVSLNELYSITDPTWPAAYEMFREALGFVDPGNFFIASGPVVFRTAIVVSALFGILLIAMAGIKVWRRVR